MECFQNSSRLKLPSPSGRLLLDSIVSKTLTASTALSHGVEAEENDSTFDTGDILAYAKRVRWTSCRMRVVRDWSLPTRLDHFHHGVVGVGRDFKHA